ncbi:MAG: tRNA 2-thiouridine(34) synthase MnmA [Flavobacteriales bacterium]
MSKTVVVGLSGGVDSSVAAYLLKEQGYNVIALFMKNWHDETVVINNECPWIDDSNDALAIAEQLDIPFQTLDLSAEYKERIVDYMFSEYNAGRTPNPDVLCNREIKFDVFLNAALKLGADFVATGHYCRKGSEVIEGEEIHKLLAGKDDNKDQSYFLCQLNQFQLSKALFPIGELQKSEVRDIARAQNLVTAEKKDSQGLCFVGKIKLPDFLQQQLQPKKGRIIEIPEGFSAYSDYQTKSEIADLAAPFIYQQEDGIDKGEHQGAHYFTVGQRKGLGVGGTEFPLFVIATDVNENIVYVGQGTEHPGLFRKALKVAKDEIHWIREDLRLNSGEQLTCDVRIRYRQDLEKATVFQMENDLYILFEYPQRGITSGQFAAWYLEDELLGSGVIS